ncbi:MAG: spore germination protein [Ignavibacteriales bacterium]
MRFRKTGSGKPPSKVKVSESIYISKNLNETISYIKSELGDPSDLCISISKLGSNKDLSYASIYIQNLVDISRINTLSIEISQIALSYDKLKSITSDGYFNIVKNNLSSFRKSQEGSDYETLINFLLSGGTILLLEGCSKFLSIYTGATEGRSVQEPTSQTVIKGPKEGFTERIDINIALLRKRIKNKDLRIEELSLGTMTNTKIVVMYIDKIAKKEIIDEIKKRLSRIVIDNLSGSSYIEELIKDDRYTIFPTFFNSERPDAIASQLIEGRVAIVLDGTPFAITAPAVMAEFFQSSEDYYHKFWVASFIRLIRYLSFFFALLVPAIYIALITFNQEVIPTALLISIAAQREGLPFPAFLEAMLMEITFEIIREAGLRMPRAIGPTISIVGGLVLGQAAVEAGIVSSVLVVLVAITAVSSFAISNYAMSNAVRVLRFGLMVLAGLMGLYGVFMGMIIITLHLCKLKSIGVPYLTPFAPHIKGGYKDTIIRSPLWANKLKPVGISDDNTPRVDDENTVKNNQKEKPEFR